MILKIKEKEKIAFAVQYEGPWDQYMVQIMDGVPQDAMNTVTKLGVWKMKLTAPDGTVDSVNVGDWVIKNDKGVLLSVTDTKFSKQYDIIGPLEL